MGDAKENGPDVTDLRPESTMREMVEAVWKLPRDLVSEGYDATLRAFGSQVPMQVHKYPSGDECWGWIVPQRWTCHEGYIETVDGERLISYANCPLHVASYSQSVDRIVSRDELFDHLRTHPIVPEGIPFHYFFYDRDWAFCCSKRLRQELDRERYRVVIRSEFTPGSLKVGEVIVRGRSDRTVVLCAHIDHPYQVNDGLIGAAVGVEVMRRLMERSNLEYTYRLLLVPENIGSVAYLSKNERLIPKMCGGIFLEMLGLDNPLFLQHSSDGDTPFDRVCAEGLCEVDPDLRTGDFLRVVTNDERQFNAPGVRVPMVSLSRVEMPFLEGPVFPEYHSHLDDPSLVSDARLEEACEALLAVIDRWERTPVPYARFKGEPFLTGHDIHFDFVMDPVKSQALFETMYLVDGRYSIEEIAEKVNLDVRFVETIVSEFEEKGLVEVLGQPGSEGLGR